MQRLRRALARRGLRDDGTRFYGVNESGKQLWSRKYADVPGSSYSCSASWSPGAPTPCCRRQPPRTPTPPRWPGFSASADIITGTVRAENAQPIKDATVEVTSLETNVTQVIEQELNGIEGFLYMSSSSQSNGTASITLTFDPGTNIVDVVINHLRKKIDSSERGEKLLRTESGIGYRLVIPSKRNQEEA